MEQPSRLTGSKIRKKQRFPVFRGFTLQLFLVIVLPLSALVLAVAFGSQSLHHIAMRDLVGDRDLNTVRAAARSLERELSRKSNTIQVLSRSLNGNAELNDLILTQNEILAEFNGGIALFSSDGSLVSASSTDIDWDRLPDSIPDVFNVATAGIREPRFSTIIPPGSVSSPFVFVSVVTLRQQILVGAFSPNLVIEESIGNLSSSGQTSVLVISPSVRINQYQILYYAGSLQGYHSESIHPGFAEVMNGKSGITYLHSSSGEHVVAYSPVQPIGWGLIFEEAWEDISNPYLANTQAAPLILAPLFLLALLAIWFGARRIVTPLQKLEKQAASLAAGDFDAINQPVGGIEEIQNLQAEMVTMTAKLKTAQQALRNYIGAITSSVESERKNLARELHDDTIQSLIALNQRVQMTLVNAPEPQVKQLRELQSMVQQTMTNLRRLIHGLRPIYLEDLGLAASLEMLIRETGQMSNLPITFTIRGQERRLEPKIEMSIYRMVQESLNNVIRHAGAAHAWVELDFTGDQLIITVGDDGIGFEVPENSAKFPQSGHYGLLGLEERTEIIHGELEIRSKPGSGTTIVMKI